MNRKQLRVLTKRLCGKSVDVVDLATFSQLSADARVRVLRRIRNTRKRSPLLGTSLRPRPSEIFTIPAELFDCENRIVDHLIAFKQEFLAFREERKSFECAFLLGKNGLAHRILDQIQQRFGHSLWCNQSRVAVRSVEDGLDGALEAASVDDPISDWLLHSYAKFCGSRLPPTPILDEVRAQLEPFVVEFQLVAYLVIAPPHAASFLPDEIDTSFLMSLLWAFTPQDRLILIERLIGLWVAHGQYPPFTEENWRRLEVSGLMRPSQVAIVNELALEECLDNQAIAIADHYSRGDYRRAIDTATEVLLAEPFNINITELLVRACYRSDEQPLPHIPAHSPARRASESWLRFLKQNRNRASTAALLQIGLMLVPTSWGIPIISSILRQGPSDDAAIQLDVWNATASNHLAPQHLAVQGMNGRPLVNALAPDRLVNPSIDLFRYRAGQELKLDPLSMPSYRRSKYHVLRSLATSNPTKGHHDLVRFLGSNNVTSLDLGEVAHAAWEIATNRSMVGLAADILAWATVSEPEFVTFRRVNQAYTMANGRPAGAFGEFSWALVCCYRLRHQDSEQGRASLAVAFEDAMARCGVDRASALSKLTKHLSGLAQRVLVPFLRDVCRPDVMDSTLVEFASEPELVERERIAILQHLREIDPEESEAYLQEAIRRTRALALQGALRHVEMSKIQVGTDELIRRLATILEETATVYMVIRTMSSVRLADTLTTHAPLAIIAPGRRVVPVSGDAAVRIAGLMIRTCAEKFARDSHHGIDRYIGLRIRHGVFAGKIRPILEEKHLVTKKAITGEYTENLYWGMRWKNEDTAHTIKGQQALQEFSRKVDYNIQWAVRSLFRVRSNTHPKGGLDYEFDAHALVLIESEMQKAKTVEDLLELIFSHLLRRTEEGLERIRTTLRGRILEDILSGLDELAAKLDSLGLATPISNYIAQTRTALPRAFATVEEWFTLGGATTYDDYALSLVVDAALAEIATQHPHCEQPTVSTHEDPTMKGRSLVPLLDCLLILLDNAMKYGEEGSILLKCVVGKTALKISVLNSVSLGGRERLVDRVSTLRARLQAGSIESARLDVGSGLAKVSRILATDLDSNPRLSELAANDNTIEVTLVISNSNRLVS